MFLDGSPQGRTAWMQTPYQGDDAYYGYATMSDEETAACIRKSLLEHQQQNKEIEKSEEPVKQN